MNKTSIKMFLRKGLIFLLFLSASVIILQSCYPYDDINVQDADVVATFYDNATNFSDLGTYAISDTIFTFDSNGDIVPSGDISNSNANQILNSIKSNMASFGFEELTTNQSSADVVMAAFVSSSTWVSGGCYGGYYSYWYPYYGWCYPVAYTYTTGSIIIVMSRPDANNPETVWIAGCNGVVSGTVTNSRINSDINQAFTQSPYLGNGK
jgi:hypothetical protein